MQSAKLCSAAARRDSLPPGWEGDHLWWWKEPGVQLRYVYFTATKLVLLALSFRHAFACHLPPQGGLSFPSKSVRLRLRIASSTQGRTRNQIRL